MYNKWTCYQNRNLNYENKQLKTLSKILLSLIHILEVFLEMQKIYFSKGMYGDVGNISKITLVSLLSLIHIFFSFHWEKSPKKYEKWWEDSFEYSIWGLLTACSLILPIFYSARELPVQSQFSSGSFIFKLFCDLYNIHLAENIGEKLRSLQKLIVCSF